MADRLFKKWNKMQHKHKKIESLILNFILMLASLIIALALAEVLLRFLKIGGNSFEHPRYLYRTSDTLGYEYTPNFNGIFKTDFNFNTKIKINSKGLRDYEYSYDKPSNVFRILVLGDSFTAGLQVQMEDTYPKVIERLLKNKNYGNYRYEVINSGVSGYNTIQEFEFLKEKGIKFKPDIVVIGFCMSNDIKDNYLGSLYTVIDGWLANRIKENTNYLFVNIKAFVRKYSRLYCFITNKIKESLVLKKMLIKMNVVVPDLLPDKLSLYSKHMSEEVKKEWEFTGRILRDIKKFADDNSIKLLVVTIPDQFQTEGFRWRLIMNQYKLIPEDYDIDNPQKTLIEICDKEDVMVLDLTEGLRKYADKKERLYIENEYHWNKYGHLCVAKEIYNFLNKQKNYFMY
ncbi:MAG: GDSL-type esterase/lipase family protein [Candidatus Omnitrophica bacterium]|nr:GDSL-type esterase/lipase family protein [Candidatus Omnitrophota bacterium]MDD5552841.1 GDSL-type esterase/lipase family protein [Candidatus Omnitrophota bacterium]